MRPLCVWPPFSSCQWPSSCRSHRGCSRRRRLRPSTASSEMRRDTRSLERTSSCWKRWKARPPTTRARSASPPAPRERSPWWFSCADTSKCGVPSTFPSPAPSPWSCSWPPSHWNRSWSKPAPFVWAAYPTWRSTSSKSWALRGRRRIPFARFRPFRGYRMWARGRGSSCGAATSPRPGCCWTEQPSSLPSASMATVRSRSAASIPSCSGASTFRQADSAPNTGTPSRLWRISRP